MKKKINFKKWVFNYLFYGYSINIIIVIVVNFIFKAPIITKQEIIGSFATAFIVMPLSIGFKNLFFEYKEIWNKSRIDRKIFIILGLAFVVYGVYYRARLTWSFK